MSAAGSDLRPARDPDRLLAGYRSARAQDTLFDLRGEGPGSGTFGGTGYDEFVDATGTIRPSWQDLGDLIGERGRAGLERLRTVVRALVDNDGITYIEVDRHGEAVTNGQGISTPGPWHLDGIPLLLSAADWETLEAGVVQRSRLLDAVLTDLYGPRRAITSGILPPQLLFAHPGYIRASRGIENPGRHQLFMHGCDLSRAADGRFLVNADWTQAPSGAGYALADRRVVAHAVPDVYERVGPRPASPFAQALRLALIDAAPEAAEDPVVVVLGPGIHSETAFDQAYLASVLGFPLVESADLVVRDGRLWMRSLGSLKRVDVVLRRVDAEYADPLDLRPDSRLGVVGLVEVQRRGAVTVVNTLGAGILESPGLQRFLPQLAERLLGEKPLLDTPQLFWGGFDRERSHLLSRLSSLLIKSTVGGETLVGPALSAAERDELTARIEAQPWQWVGQELPQFSSAPTDRYPGTLSAASVGMRLFTVSQSGGYAPMVGGLGYVLVPGNAAYKLNSVAAKDIWVRPPTRARAETLTVPPVELPSGVRFISSPRVLSDLFWMGRYAERAEHLARLLIVTRERYHEYRYRQDMEGSECVPVLLGALGQLTGADAGTAGSYAETVTGAQRTLWALTVDRQRPGSLAQSIEGLGLAARSVRDQMSNDTWMVLGAVERALAQQAGSPPTAQRGSRVADDTQLAAAQQQMLAGMLALSGVAAESMVHDAGWTVMDIGKRIERGLSLTALLRATLTTERGPGAEQTITESALVVCESSVLYRRRNLGKVSVAAVADLVLFDGENPRSLVFQLERLRADLRALPGASGSTRPERLVDEISTRLRRLDLAELEEVDDEGHRVELDGLLKGVEVGLRELSDIITRTQLSLPGGMQPLWGPDQRRVVP
ncbi:circularly permuted type 2 ATP-grasp protein [Candidatus Mycolicibacterium alkanivorans]|uniref:Circularly permuted type 2 ATP-grasp protein n=1 Tax=Candidatus Mycolicibacterium alkanivorans TaxID=2954114 RepID=A0ABS9YYJ9_9MYCO|nr:circularly permuted type 2 ATP-grasp protein [Candidatus Mycolicibacterium alkanivorans]MCI4676163.1 circularly permuted type 2 ATP-grasp protein [Candidatus Mycolicibacterium alkanivorans]